MTRGAVPSAISVLATLIVVTWRRLFRGRAVWVSVVIAALPIVLAAATEGQRDARHAVDAVQFLVMALLPPLFVASSLGEEIEDRTTTYLWSRPIPRWTIVIGKLIALAPLAVALVVAGCLMSRQLARGEPPPFELVLALSAGTLAIAAMSAGIATLVPRHGMALSIVYLVIFDLALGAIPASIQNICVTHHVRQIGVEGGDVASSVIRIAILACMWLAISLWRIRRLES